MRNILITLFLTLSAAAATALPANHVDLTTVIVDFLSRTELCLNSCRDAGSAAAAIPQLKELRKECDAIVETQRSLPEPTIQDYMAVQSQMEAFNTVWNAIRDHIERLENEQLLTPEMREILHIAPANHDAH